MLSDRKLLERFFFVPQIMKAESSYFNVTLFLILHISAQIICLLFLLPCKGFLIISYKQSCSEYSLYLLRSFSLYYLFLFNFF